MVRRLLGALLLLSAAASADESPRHLTWVRAALARVPLHHEDRAQGGKAEELDRVALAVARQSVDAPRPPREWAALILAVGAHESGFASRIIANRCKPRECDRGRAIGFGQVHANALNRADWSRAGGDVELQAKLTSDALKRAYWTCARSGVPWAAATLSSYAGKRCGAAWPGLEQRLATFNRLLATPSPKAGGST